jgi:hypothetical protein
MTEDNGENMEKKNILLESLKVTEEIGSGVGSVSISQRYGSAPKSHGSPTLTISRLTILARILK